MTQELKQIKIYTDGSCETRSGDGGWAYLIRFQDQGRKVSGYQAGTTNNRMELTAAVEALSALTEPCSVTVVTDSQYLKNAFTARWLANWQRNGWKTASRQPVKNRDLWEKLLELTAIHKVKWSWTRGHSGHDENELVDTLALAARKSRKGIDQRC
jgi:ribonuclease HI